LEPQAVVNPFRLKISDHPGRIFNFIDKPEDQLLFKNLRNNGAPLLLELGSGSGGHLIERGRLNPASLVCGIELRYKRAVRTIEKGEKLGADNIYIVRVHAHQVPEIFESKSLEGIWINFPDPWDKRKKNRILRPDMLRQYLGLIKPNGFFSFKTDHLEMFETVLGQIQNEELLDLERVIHDAANSEEYLKDSVETEFESMFKSQRLPIYHLLGTRQYRE